MDKYELSQLVTDMMAKLGFARGYGNQEQLRTFKAELEKNESLSSSEYFDAVAIASVYLMGVEL